jgi:hypothetical protein
MAWTATKEGDSVFGNLRVTHGTYLSTGATTTGNLNTGLHQVVAMQLTASGAGIVAGAPTINATFPADGTAVPIIVTAATGGKWVAYGF